MKYLALLSTVAGLYLYFTRETTVVETTLAANNVEVAQLSTGPQPATAAPASALKRPLNRTHETLGQVAQRNGAGEF